MHPRQKGRRRSAKAKAKAKDAAASFPQPESRAGLLVTTELEKALAECKARVERIVRDCRANNRRFRDVEFDLENDRELCLFGLSKENRELRPWDVQRATKIFAKPSFFIDGADSNDIVQGRLGDCWFLSALSTMTTAKGLMEKFCVARDEQVGVYGWIFFRDSGWVTVIIDDLLYTTNPKFEELTSTEQGLYHRDKNLYNNSARQGAKSLYFARSEQEGETWVSLIEKAYAKLHGDYTAIDAGYSCEAIEDLTGGVSTFIPTKDILDSDLFWKEELLLATKDRLFGCGFDTLDSTRSGNEDRTVNGLIGGHAYSVLRAVEYNGKRFVVLRNPWGDSEWTGRWSDGSKEWTEKWLPAMKVLQHTFGDDGEFVMEYSDFLDNFDLVERTLLFDETWIMANQWLQVTARPPTAAWSYGDVSFTISIPAPTKAIIVLSKLDERYFSDISGNSCWTFDFALFKKGETELIAQSTLARFYLRSVNLEAQLEKGEYVVHVRLDRAVNDEVQVYHSGNTNTRKFARVQAERAKSQSIASNHRPSAPLQVVPLPLNVLAGQNVTEVETKATEVEKKLKAAEALEKKAQGTEEADKANKDGGVGEDQSTSKDVPAPVLTEEPEQEQSVSANVQPPRRTRAGQRKSSVAADVDEDWVENHDEVDLDDLPASLADEDLGFNSAVAVLTPPLPPIPLGEAMPYSEAHSDHDADDAGSELGSGYDNDTVVLGLRVYTHKEAPAVVGGQLRQGVKARFGAFMDAGL
ncbi:calpain catalytic domain-containing protein [Favolaschia claudopus]|uniref:Calpain catalytic domain-containing protein n=1 Tax=Favolaschia claudopus TaxID=2862362 RepID=A0AAW0C0J9_9AGAR